MHDADWPALPYSEWRDTAATLQLWTQVVGKIRLALTPWLNHGWQVTLYVTARGLGTRTHADRPRDPRTRIRLHRSSPSRSHQPRRGAGFSAHAADGRRILRAVLDLLARLGVAVKINEMPSEVADPIRFSEDRVHASYDPAAAHRFWRVLLRVNRVFAAFPQRVSRQGQPRAFVLGKLRPCGDAVFRKAGAAPSRRRARPAGRRDARGLFARGEQRGLLARQRRVSARRLLFVRLSRTGRGSVTGP